MLRGALISESLRPGVTLDLDIWRIARIARWDMRDSVIAGQPAFWTVIEFEAEDLAADRLAGVFSRSLLREGGWYCDFAVGDERVVVFADRIFRYPRGDAAGRAEAAAYGRTVGVPEHQLDWKD